MHVEGLPIGTVGGILAKVTLPLDGEYQLAVKMFRTNLGVMRGLEYEHEIEYTVDGARVHMFRDGRRGRLQGQPRQHDEGRRRRSTSAAASGCSSTAGPHVIARGVRRAQRRA